jgi:CBS domain-containing protein
MPAVKDIMSKVVATVTVNQTIFEAAELMSTMGISCVLVVDSDNPVGLITERDIVSKIVAKNRPLDTKVTEIMSKELITIDPDSSLKEAARLMSNNKIRRLPVLKENKLVGIVSASDFVRNVGKKTLTEEILDAMGRYPAEASL